MVGGRFRIGLIIDLLVKGCDGEEGRKRRVEGEETLGGRGKSPRGEDDEAGLLDYDDERDGVSDADMSQD